MNMLQEIEAAEPPWLRALPYIIGLLSLVVLCAVSFSYGKHVEHLARVAQVAQLQDQQHQELARLDQAHRQQLQQAMEQAAANKAQADARMAALDAQFTKEINDAKRKTVSDLAAVRAGTLRLRERFTCPGASGPGGGAAPAGQPAGMGDAAAAGGLRREDAAFLVQESDRADAIVRQLSACQAIVVQDRAAGSTHGSTKP